MGLDEGRRMHSSSQLIATLGDLVTVWAHPDDETYLAAGVMAMARSLGRRVTCVVATDGDLAGSPSDRVAIGRVRLTELSQALDELDVHDVELLHLPDGGCADLDPAGPTAAIAEVLASRSPDTIITFGADGLTGHADHRAVSRWTMAAARSAAPTSRILVPTITPDIVAGDRDINDRFDVYEQGLPATHERDDLAIELMLRGEWLDTKVRALRCHDSQTGGLIEAVGLDRYRRWVTAELFVDAVSG
jgi:LmbE family N-acetylglucosaminyl deacetylase